MSSLWRYLFSLRQAAARSMPHLFLLIKPSLTSMQASERAAARVAVCDRTDAGTGRHTCRANTYSQACSRYSQEQCAIAPLLLQLQPMHQLLLANDLISLNPQVQVASLLAGFKLSHRLHPPQTATLPQPCQLTQSICSVGWTCQGLHQLLRSRRPCRLLQKQW